MPHPAINHAARKGLTIHARMAQHTELDLDDFAVFAADVYRHGYRLNLGAYTHVIGRRWQELFACFDRGYGVLCATPERSALDFDFAVASGALAEDALHLAAAGSSGKPGRISTGCSFSRTSHRIPLTPFWKVPD